MPSQPFFSFDLHQQVNQWICMAFVALLGFLVVLYYLVNKAEAFGNQYVAVITTIEPASTTIRAAHRNGQVDVTP